METAKPGESFPSFVSAKKGLKYLFFGGKGGVGKTALAGATAYYLSEMLGKKTLISSTSRPHLQTAGHVKGLQPLAQQDDQEPSRVNVSTHKTFLPQRENNPGAEKGPTANLAGWNQKEDGRGQRDPYGLGEDRILLRHLATRPPYRGD